MFIMGSFWKVMWAWSRGGQEPDTLSEVADGVGTWRHSCTPGAGFTPEMPPSTQEVSNRYQELSGPA